MIVSLALVIQLSLTSQLGTDEARMNEPVIRINIHLVTFFFRIFLEKIYEGILWVNTSIYPVIKLILRNLVLTKSRTIPDNYFGAALLSLSIQLRLGALSALWQCLGIKPLWVLPTRLQEPFWFEDIYGLNKINSELLEPHSWLISIIDWKSPMKINKHLWPYVSNIFLTIKTYKEFNSCHWH